MIPSGWIVITVMIPWQTSGQHFNLSNPLVYDQILAKLMQWMQYSTGNICTYPYNPSPSQHCSPLALWFLYVVTGWAGRFPAQLPGSATSSVTEHCSSAAAVTPEGTWHRTLPPQSPLWPSEKGSQAAAVARSPAAWRCPGIPGTGRLVSQKTMSQASGKYTCGIYFCLLQRPGLPLCLRKVIKAEVGEIGANVMKKKLFL